MQRRTKVKGKHTQGKRAKVKHVQVKPSNSQLGDSSGKLIFDEPVLCAQFLRDYVDLPFMKAVQPEDIEDVSEQFVPLFAQERNADRVKRINIRGEEPFFLVSLIEHKTKIEYDVCMQIFRYMVYIWEVYGKDAEKKCPGITRRKGFRYPPILPIIYYEGNDRWTAPFDFKSRVSHAEVFRKYIPDFEYYLVPICDYSNEELLEKADEMSLIMLINKLQTEEDVAEFRRISTEKFQEIVRETPKPLLDKIAQVMLAFLLRANAPVEEAEELVERVRESKMAQLFENMQKMDIQAMRREVEAAKKELEMAKKLAKEAEQQWRKEAEFKVENGIQIVIENCQEFALSKEATVERLISKFHLDKDEAEGKTERYWK